ncbi:MAG: cell division protein ZipA [Sedimenticolaceae bacterium]
MDPDLVRLILVLLGILLVAGIYLWDRYKRAMPRPRAPKRAAKAMSMRTQSSTVDKPAARAEPRLDAIPWADDHDALPEPLVLDPEPGRAGALPDPEPPEPGEWVAEKLDQDSQAALDLRFDAHGDGDYLATDPALHDDIERLIVVVNLAAPEGGFSGAAIEKACSAAGLVFGDMSIYHFHEPASGRVMFSMASSVEPGSFPSDDMARFTTPGLSLFTQLPSVCDGLQIYDQLLQTAHRLAGLLRAEVQDERRNKLTRQMQEHTREAIIEHQRKIRLARRRH